MAEGNAKSRHGKTPVVTAAVKNFAERGYHGTSVRDIARDAGVTVASIYHHFSSKQEMLQQIMELTLRDLIGSTRTALDEAPPGPSEQLAALVRVWIIFHTDHRAEALIGASELRSLEATGRTIVVALRDQQQELFNDVIDRGVAEGVFTTAYPREAARAVINMGYSVASWYRPDGEVTPTEMADRYVELALGTVGFRAG